MISYIKGELTEVFEDTVVVETNGIGYNIRVPGSVLDRLPSVGSPVRIYTYLYVKEDAMNLFGFLSRDDLSVFKLLLNVSGIGPKGALAILSTIGPDDLRFAVLSEDVKTISSAPGIGAKTAKRLIIELKDKLKLAEVFETALANKEKVSSENDVLLAKNEAVEALVALGYASAQAMKAVQQVENAEEKDSEQILKEALKKLI
ncbi:Holliday junction branch migration protein RuvA [Lachnospira pectinoschiza]|uniref:Holliday junction branch migration protein RuvA n=1 Tax=Lachnospira pectinoschiza TaxID=28052 RepID=UPI001D060237|nr:Holliday junction branch migration protein RuvA [Lachnospira pectinoschiza]MCB6141944.1 Holliday junction branch migration protein RuvA [Lachnospira pectinoschiza]